MEYLKPYKSYVSRLLIVWHLLCIGLTSAVAFTLSTIMEPSLVITISAIILVASLIAVDAILTRPAIAATEFLSRVILHVSSESSGMPAPDINIVKSDKEFFQRLASYVYDMSSKSVMSSYPTKQATTAEPTSQATTQIAEPVQNLLNLSPLPIITAGKDLLIKDVSQSALLFLQLNQNDVVGKNLYDIVKLSFSSSDTLDSWVSFASEKAVTSSRSWDRVKLSLKDESVKQVDISARFSNDEPSGRDITVVLFDHSEKYGRDDEGAGFVAMAVHELRTPLTIMRGYIEVFEEELADKLDTEQSEFLRNLSVQAQQLGSFVSNIQNLARIEENSLSLELKSEDWCSVLTSALNDMEIRAKVRHKEIKRKLADDLPAIGVDKSTIYEVVINIVENAIKYTHSDQPITVSTYLKDPNWIETTIEDHGIGIPDSLIGHIFDKFYRSHRTSRSVGGTGLGLYISKKIIEAHGGEIWVKSKEGEGATFGFTLPTYSSIASSANTSDNKAIERNAHGWIKNHTLYRG